MGIKNLLGIAKSLAPSLLQQIAPMIGTSIGGPAGLMAAKLILNKWSGAPDDAALTPTELAMAVENATPEQLTELKELDNNFKVEMEKLGVDVFALEVKSQESARELAKRNMWPHIFLTVAFVLSYFGMLFGLMTDTLTVPENIEGTLLVLIGLLTREIPTIMQFWFGYSSHETKEKTL